MAAKVNGFSLAYTAIGGVVLWSGIKGTTLSSTFRGLLQGQAPSANQEPISHGARRSGGLNTASSDSGATEPSRPRSRHPAGMTALQEAAAAYGWGTGAEWKALIYVEMREAGFSPTARNPSSGALRDGAGARSRHQRYGRDARQRVRRIRASPTHRRSWPTLATPTGQAMWMCNYIKATYGDPIAAAAHERAAGWY